MKRNVCSNCNREIGEDECCCCSVTRFDGFSRRFGDKPTNPKDMIGVNKAPLSTVSGAVMLEVGLAMLEGAAKYGRHNYRAVGVRASVYYDATMRHLISWWEGEDIDPDSGISHVTKAIASLVVLRDAMIQEKMQDDRAPRSQMNMALLNSKAAEILKRHADKSPWHYTIEDTEQCKSRPDSKC